MGSLFLTQARVHRGGEVHRYWQIREGYWDRDRQRTRQRVIASLGQERSITLDEAEQIAKDKGVDLDDILALRAKGLEVEGATEDPPPVVLTCSVERRVYDALVERAERRGVDVARHAADILTGVALNRDLA